MRVIKKPEERKKEILDCAIRLFCTRGYEETSISDIAEEAGISQGLCYRYYASKQEIRRQAVETYAELLTESVKKHFDKKFLSLREQISDICRETDGLETAEKSSPELYALFHAEGANEIHGELTLKVAEKVCAYAQKSIENAVQNGEIECRDTKTAACFSVYGQIGIFMRADIDRQTKGRLASEALTDYFKFK